MAVAVAGPFKALFGAIEIKTSFESKKNPCKACSWN